MTLLIQLDSKRFDEGSISTGCLLYAKHSTWTEGRCGIVVAHTETEMVVQYHPGIGNVTNHFRVLAKEVDRGDWELRWSEDLMDIHTYQVTDENGGAHDRTTTL